MILGHRMSACELCEGDGGTILFRSERYRVVAVTGEDATLYPGFCRVVWNTHVKEMTDLTEADRATFMAAVYRLELVLRETLRPVKMNLASLGNVTPHLHWHVIPRQADDAAYPKPVWALPPGSVVPANIGGNNKGTADAIDWQTAVIGAFVTAAS